MSPRYAARSDGNTTAIDAAARAVGASILDLHGVGDDCPDRLYGFAGRNLLVEIKNPDGRNRLEPGQRIFIETWAGQVAVVRTPEELLELFGFREPGEER